jgi:hypothetical protein
MVYAVQNCKVYIGLYPSSGIYYKKSRFGDWMGQDRPTQSGPLERASLNHWTNPA